MTTSEYDYSEGGLQPTGVNEYSLYILLFLAVGTAVGTDRSVVRTNFCVPLEPRAAGGGSSGTQKLIKQKFLMRVFCPHGPLRKYYRSVFSARTDHYENIFEAFFLPNPPNQFVT